LVESGVDYTLKGHNFLVASSSLSDSSSVSFSSNSSKASSSKKEVCDLVPYSLRADEGHGHERNVPGMKRTFRETTRTSLTMPEDLTELE
jgi:hypothetical protein